MTKLGRTIFVDKYFLYLFCFDSGSKELVGQYKCRLGTTITSFDVVDDECSIYMTFSCKNGFIIIVELIFNYDNEYEQRIDESIKFFKPFASICSGVKIVDRKRGRLVAYGDSNYVALIHKSDNKVYEVEKLFCVKKFISRIELDSEGYVKVYDDEFYYTMYDTKTGEKELQGRDSPTPFNRVFNSAFKDKYLDINKDSVSFSDGVVLHYSHVTRASYAHDIVIFCRGNEIEPYLML